ncbi:MAG: hypothetical protein M1815_004385 [Lichina confinis]|nr:MAG: hypothetical protein M1815_004385 [Lichina confinis]
MCSSCKGPTRTHRALQRGQQSGSTAATGKEGRARRSSDDDDDDDELGRRHRPVGSAGAPADKSPARLRLTGADMKSYRNKNEHTDGCRDGNNVRDSSLVRTPLSTFPLRRTTGVGGEGPGPNVASSLTELLIVLVAARDGSGGRRRYRPGRRRAEPQTAALSGQQVGLAIGWLR